MSTDRRPSNSTTGGVDTFPRPAPSPSILASFVSLGGGVLIARAIAFLGTAFLTRKLGPHGFGIIGLALAICSYFAMAVQASVAPVGSREVARHPERAASMAKGVIVVRLAMASIGIALVALVVLVIEKPLDVKEVILLTSLIMLSQALITAWVYKGLGRNRMVGMSLILNQIFYVGALFWFVRDSADVFWVPVAVVLGELAAALFLGIPLFHRSESKADIRDGIRILKSSKFVVSSRLLTHSIRTTDVVLLGLLVGEDSVGLYAAGYRLSLLVLGIGLALHTAYLPILARAAQKGAAESDRIVRGAFEASTAVALPLVVGGVICSEELLSVLFGSDFEPGAIAFSLLLVGIGFHYIHGLANHVLLVFDETRADMRLRAIASTINVALNLWWIPRWGIVGAASATLVSQVVITVLSTWVCNRIGVGLFSSRSWKAVLSVAIMAAWLLTIASPWPLGLQISTSALVYALSLLLLGGTPADFRPGK